MKNFKNHDQMSETELDILYTKMYKDACGLRPRTQPTQSGTWYIRLDGKIIKDKQGNPYIFCGQAAADKAAATIQIAFDRQANEDLAITQFEDRVANLMHPGTNRKHVIDGLMDAKGVNADYEYFAYTQGLPYQYFAAEQAACVA